MMWARTGMLACILHRVLHGHGPPPFPGGTRLPSQTEEQDNAETFWEEKGGARMSDCPSRRRWGELARWISIHGRGGSIGGHGWLWLLWMTV